MLFRNKRMNQNVIKNKTGKRIFRLLFFISSVIFVHLLTSSSLLPRIESYYFMDSGATRKFIRKQTEYAKLPSFMIRL